jgi:hypothetical protein
LGELGGPKGRQRKRGEQKGEREKGEGEEGTSLPGPAEAELIRDAGGANHDRQHQQDQEEDARLAAGMVEAEDP